MDSDTLDSLAVEQYLKSLQKQICSQFEVLESTVAFEAEAWNFKDGGGGDTRILENGEVFEKAGVNFSSIRGMQLPEAATVQRSSLKNKPFAAIGISVVAHPLNPYVPTTHMNLRFILVGDEVWWFGGGFDLTPYYGFEEDAVHWHTVAKHACDPFGDNRYQEYKRWCDEYFYLKHRNETRGIGGLFFDDLKEQGFDFCFRLIQSVGNHFLPAYMPIVKRRMNMKYGQRERDFQLYRRGRYVEFNLVYDRGTLFGLQSKGRTESILMSLPPQVAWKYNWQPERDTPEFELYNRFLKPQDWLSINGA